VFESIKKNLLDKALKRILEFSFKANSYFQKKAPWKTKDKTCLYLSANAVRVLSVLLYPYIPLKASEIWNLLNLEEKIEEQRIQELKTLKIRGGHKIKKPKIVFERVEDLQIEKIKNLLYSRTKKGNNMNEVSFEEFKKIEMKVGKIEGVIDIPGAKKLYKLIVSFGDEKKQAITGLKGYYKPEELKGKKFIFVTNLEKRKFMGEESQCMILAAEDDEGNLALIKPDKDIKEGSRVY